MNTSSSTSSSTSSFSSINLDQKFIIDSKITDTQSLRLFDKAENLDQISLKLQELPLLTSIKNKINSAFIIKIISNLRTYYEVNFLFYYFFHLVNTNFLFILETICFDKGEY